MRAGVGRSASGERSRERRSIGVCAVRSPCATDGAWACAVEDATRSSAASSSLPDPRGPRMDVVAQLVASALPRWIPFAARPRSPAAGQGLVGSRAGWMSSLPHEREVPSLPTATPQVGREVVEIAVHTPPTVFPAPSAGTNSDLTISRTAPATSTAARTQPGKGLFVEQGEADHRVAVLREPRRRGPTLRDWRTNPSPERRSPALLSGQRSRRCGIRPGPSCSARAGQVVPVPCRRRIRESGLSRIPAVVPLALAD